MMNISTDEELSASELRKFGVSTGAIFAVLFGLAIPWMWGLNYPRWPWVILLVLGALGLIVPNTLRLVHRYWMRLALLISKVTTPIILGVVFFLVVMPFGLIMRIFGGDPLALRLNGDLETYRKKSDRQSVNSLEKPY
jgi:hypothetical protein